MDRNAPAVSSRNRASVRLMNVTRLTSRKISQLQSLFQLLQTTSSATLDSLQTTQAQHSELETLSLALPETSVPVYLEYTKHTMLLYWLVCHKLFATASSRMLNQTVFNAPISQEATFKDAVVTSKIVVNSLQSPTHQPQPHGTRITRLATKELPSTEPS